MSDSFHAGQLGEMATIRSCGFPGPWRVCQEQSVPFVDAALKTLAAHDQNCRQAVLKRQALRFDSSLATMCSTPYNCPSPPFHSNSTSNDSPQRGDFEHTTEAH